MWSVPLSMLHATELKYLTQLVYYHHRNIVLTLPLDSHAKPLAIIQQLGLIPERPGGPDQLILHCVDVNQPLVFLLLPFYFLSDFSKQQIKDRLMPEHVSVLTFLIIHAIPSGHSVRDDQFGLSAAVGLLANYQDEQLQGRLLWRWKSLVSYRTETIHSINLYVTHQNKY